MCILLHSCKSQRAWEFGLDGEQPMNFSVPIDEHAADLMPPCSRHYKLCWSVSVRVHVKLILEGEWVGCVINLGHIIGCCGKMH